MGRGKRVQGVLDELPEPAADQEVAKVTGLPGGNVVQTTTADGCTFLTRVPSKFRNVFWIKMGACHQPVSENTASLPRCVRVQRVGGFFIIDRHASEGAGSSSAEVGKVQGTIAHFLFQDQIKHLQAAVALQRWVYCRVRLSVPQNPAARALPCSGQSHPRRLSRVHPSC